MSIAKVEAENGAFGFLVGGFEHVNKNFGILFKNLELY